MKRLAGGLAALLFAFVATPAYALKEVTLAPEAIHASISADGSQILVSSGQDLVPADEDGHPEFPDDNGWFRLSVGSGGFSRVARPLYNDKGEFLTFAGPSTAALAPDGVVVAGDGANIWVTGQGGSGEWSMMTGSGAFGDRIVSPSPFQSPPRIGISRDGAHVAWDSYKTSGYDLYYDGRVVVQGGMEPSLSYDGRLMAYTRQLGANAFDVRVRDMRSGKERVVSSDAKNHAKSGYGASISGDGRYVAFRSADVLVPGARNWMHVYVKDLKTDKVRIASLTAKGHQAKGLEAKFIDPYDGEDRAQISSDGRYVAFESRAPLAKGDSGNNVDLYVKDMFEGGVVRIPDTWDGNIPGGEFRLAGNGRWLTLIEQDRSLRLVSLTDDSPFCEVPAAHPDDGLTDVDLDIVNRELAPTKAEAAAAVKALAADSKRNPGNRAANAKLLASLRDMQKRYRVRAAAAAGKSDEELAKLVDDAKGSLLEQGDKEFSAYLEGKGHGDKVDLAHRLLTLKEVLNGDADEEKKQEILKDSINDFIEKLAGKDKAKKYTGQALEAYKALQEYLKGTFPKYAKERARKELLKQFKKASQKFFGDDAPELVDRLLDLRDVLAGSVDDKKRAKMLEDATAALAQKLLGKTLLNSPQVRAAMFGFELGRAFGDRLAADLDFIANKELASDCAVALGPSQSSPGAIDYSHPARGIVPKPLWHEGWECVILPDAFVQGVGGGLVQATRPESASRKDKILWRITTSGTVVTYDPSFSR